MLDLGTDCDPWLLDEDGITDFIAIEVAIRGQRPVRLTREERETAGVQIILNGGSATDVIERLRLPVPLAGNAAGHVITHRAGRRAGRSKGTARPREKSA